MPAESARDAEQVAGYREFMDAVHHEDIPMCDGVMAGLRSSVWKPAQLSRQEALLPHFYRWLVDAMRRA